MFFGMVAAKVAQENIVYTTAVTGLYHSAVNPSVPLEIGVFTLSYERDGPDNFLYSSHGPTATVLAALLAVKRELGWIGG